MKDIPKDKYEEISDRLKAIEKLLQFKQKQPKEIFLDNQEFLQIMNISKRTAQSWRDSGLIGYSMIGCKVYYKITDIHGLIEKHYHKAKDQTS